MFHFPVLRLAAMVAVMPLVIPALAQDHYPLPDSIRPMAMRSLPLGRAFDDTTSGQINPAPRVPKPRVISKAEWGGKPTSGTAQAHFPGRVTLHHGGDAKPLLPTDDAVKKLVGLQRFSQVDKKWPDIPYHFCIDLQGNIYEARDPLTAGDTNTTYNPRGHLLVEVMGNYEIQAPNENQMKAMCDLMAWACDYYNMNPELIRGHMDFAQTACPGKYLYPYVASGAIEGEVRKRIAAAYLGEKGEEKR
jgi:hypothetical protein